MSQWDEDFPDDEIMSQSKQAPVSPHDGHHAHDHTGEKVKTSNFDKENFVNGSKRGDDTGGAKSENGEAQATSKDDSGDDEAEDKPQNMWLAMAKADKKKRRDMGVPKENVPSLVSEKVESKISTSDDIVNEQESRLEAELEQLVKDIRRLGERGPQVTFGELFDDDQVANYYEALVGTLKSAKRRRLVHFNGQMLLKGLHDDVVISIITL